MRDWIPEKQKKVVSPFEQANEAFERIASGRTVGKIIVKVAGSDYCIIFGHICCGIFLSLWSVYVKVGKSKAV